VKKEIVEIQHKDKDLRDLNKKNNSIKIDEKIAKLPEKINKSSKIPESNIKFLRTSSANNKQNTIVIRSFMKILLQSIIKMKLKSKQLKR